MAELTETEIERYSRQLLLPGWGTREQMRLKRARVAVSAALPAAALYLAGAGVGRIDLCSDGAEDLAEKIRALNPLVEVRLGPPSKDVPELVASDQSLCGQALAAAKMIRRLAL